MCRTTEKRLGESLPIAEVCREIYHAGLREGSLQIPHNYSVVVVFSQRKLEEEQKGRRRFRGVAMLELVFVSVGMLERLYCTLTGRARTCLL